MTSPTQYGGLRTVWLVAVLAGGLGCSAKGPHADAGQQPAAQTVASSVVGADSGSADLSNVKVAVPPAAPEPKAPKHAAAEFAYPPAPGLRLAPAAVRRAVTREQAVSQFCFQEFGQKIDPTLQGAVDVVVTVSNHAITDAHVASANWTDNQPGTQVDQCLDERVAQAWRVAPLIPRASYLAITWYT